MNRIFFIFLCSFIPWSYGQSSDSLVKSIRAKCFSIDNQLNQSDTVKTLIWGESTEGAEASAYFYNDTLIYIEATWLGEMGRTTDLFYFYNHHLIFVLEKKYQYNRPIYWDEERAAEIDDEVFDPEKTIITENSYYFKDNALMMRLDNEQKNEEVKEPSTIQRGNELLTTAQRLSKKLIDKYAIKTE